MFRKLIKGLGLRMTTAESARVVLKKTFSIALIFNALITLACVAGIIYGFYVSYPYWQPYSPYLLDGNLFWLAIAAAVINIFPSAAIGRALHTGRFLFHHYVYGFLVLGVSAVLLLMLSRVSIFALLTGNITDISVNAGRFFVLGGITLLVDDLPDVSTHIHSVVRWMKRGAYRARRILHAAECFLGFVSVYFFLCVSLYMVQNPGMATLANLILAGTLLVTSVFSFAVVKRKIWLKITL